LRNKGRHRLQKLQEVCTAAQVAGKRADAAENEVEHLRRKRAVSTSPPPPQIKLLVRLQVVMTQQQAPPSPARTDPDFGTAFFNSDD
jgi:hypothetical protein